MLLVNAPSSLKQSAPNEAFIVTYPNPVQDLVYIQCKDPKLLGKKTRIEIMDDGGKTLDAFDGNLTERLEYHLGDKSDGVYYVRISIANTGPVGLIKLIKNKND
jgi:hypothetical protein